MARHAIKLSPALRQGVLNLPGTTFEAKRTVERLLEEDRQKHHCFYGKIGLHNHLSHHILAAYDLGAPASLLQKIYDDEAKTQSGIRVFERRSGKYEAAEETITGQNWTNFLGEERYYASYLDFFAEKIEQKGVGEVIERYVFAPEANDNKTYMLLRFVGGAVHPLIQTGYGVEFGSDAMVAQALAQTAVHSAFYPSVFDLRGATPAPEALQYKTNEGTHRQPSKGHSLLSILRQAYDSDIMMPVMPYDPDALLSARFKSAIQDGRPEEIRRLSALWHIDTERGQAELDDKVEELLWTTTLLLVGSGRRGRKPRLDFFLMHMLNASLFVPSLLAAIPTMESKAALLRAIVPVLLMYLTVRGRPRINAELAMSYIDTPRPPNVKLPEPASTALGDPRDPADVNSWTDVVASVLYAPDAHTLKVIRALYYAAQRYGRTPRGDVIGAFDTQGRETHVGIARVDGTLFIRAAGVVMDTLGWVSHGQKEGSWDRSALGWDDAWKNED